MTLVIQTEDVMRIQVTNIQRRSNGTVDTDVYRRKAFLLRRETTNQILRRLGRSVRPLLGAVAILVSQVLLSTRNLVLQVAMSAFTPTKAYQLPHPLKTSRPKHRSQ
jgi:hypothetical protein